MSRLKPKGRKLISRIHCPRCTGRGVMDVGFDTIEKARKHCEEMHGSYTILRTRKQYKEWLKEHYRDNPSRLNESLKIADAIPSSYFLSYTKYKNALRKERRLTAKEKPKGNQKRVCQNCNARLPKKRGRIPKYCEDCR